MMSEPKMKFHQCLITYYSICRREFEELSGREQTKYQIEYQQYIKSDSI